MTISKVDDFFGMNLKSEQFSVDHFSDLLGIKRKVSKDKYLQRLVAANGQKHLIVSIVKRQIILKALKPLLREPIQAYDEGFYTREVTTATARDRRYGAEEKLIWFSLIIATGKTLKQLERINFKPDTESIRRLPGSKDAKFERLWELLAEHTGDYITKFKNGEVGVNPDTGEEKKSFWNKLFS